MFKKTISIRHKFTVAMTYILLFELVIFAIMLFFGGTLGMVVSNVYINLKETTQIRTNSIGDSLNSVSEVANSSYEEINEIVNKADLANPATYDDTFYSLIPRLLTVSNGENITGAFVVLGNDPDQARLPALYLRKPDRSIQNQNYFLNISSEELIQRTGIVRDKNWSSSLNVKENNGIDFFTEPLRISNEEWDEPATTLGYWSMPYEINFDDDQVIAYCLPLRDANNNFIGVYGIEVNLNKIIVRLPYLEINSKGMGNYVLVCKPSYSDTTYKKIVASGKTFDEINSYSSNVEFQNKLINSNLYVLKTKGVKAPVYSTINEVNLWNNCRYKHNVWALCGVIESSYMNDLQNTIRNNILLAFALTMALGLLFAWAVSSVIATPIHNFLDEIKTIRADNPVVPTTTTISEINDLAHVVESLTDEITDFSAKVSTIIDLAGIDIGAFEYNASSDFVYCTDMLFSLFGMDKVGDKLFVPKEVFEEKMTMFCNRVEPDLNKVYKFKMPNGSLKFYHLKTALNEDKIIGIIQDVTRETVQEKSHKIALDRDPMTNLLNRTAFRRSLIEKITSNTYPLAAVAHFNLDRMSEINVRYGNNIGDKFISAVAMVMRKYANRITTFAARTGGDEFKFLILGNDPDEMEVQLKQLLDAIEDIRIQTIADGSVPVSISIGIAWYPKDTYSSNLLEQYAEFAMRQVKRSGKNSYKYFDKAEFAQAEKLIRSSHNIEVLISDKLIHYAFQPIIEVATGKVYGYEALMRPDATNTITPQEVIAFATEQNKLDEIERLTWFTALEDFSVQLEPLSGKKLFINSIPNQVLSDEDIAEFEDKYSNYLMDLVIEIIENEQGHSEVIDIKRSLVEKWNCLLALDDYGSGYANDNTLLQLKPQLIKLDMEMVYGIETDKDRQSLVKNIIDYAHQRGIIVLAEGIEGHSQMEALISYGVDLMQGFYLAKPSFDVVDSIDEDIAKEIKRLHSKRKR